MDLQIVFAIVYEAQLSERSQETLAEMVARPARGSASS